MIFYRMAFEHLAWVFPWMLRKNSPAGFGARRRKESSGGWGKCWPATSSSDGELSTLNIYIYILFNMLVYYLFKYSMAHISF